MLSRHQPDGSARPGSRSNGHLPAVPASRPPWIKRHSQTHRLFMLRSKIWPKMDRRGAWARADRLGEGDHPPVPLVPQRVARRAHPIGQGQHRRHGEARMRTVAGFQPVVGNPWRGMMDVVETDIPCHPLQQAGQPEKRAATQRTSTGSHCTCRAQWVPSKWCCNENSQTPTMLAGGLRRRAAPPPLGRHLATPRECRGAQPARGW